VVLGDFAFDPDTGELRRLDGEGEAAVQRLPPQPAVLLSLLAEDPGRIVSREEIRARLWPDVTVDFEQSLHFCMRQVRSALGDTARTPRYIETLPRRGYRLIAGVRPGSREAAAAGATRSGTTAPSPAATHPGPAGRRRRIGMWSWVGGAALVAALAAAWMNLGAGGRPIRLAILPFDPPAGFAFDVGTGPVADLLLARLAAPGDSPFSVVGPTTTAAYSPDAAGLRQLVSELDIDYFVNPRFLVTDEGPLMLAELIRATDGAHVWVGSFREFDRIDEMADAIADGVLSYGFPGRGKDR
jgi:DNA-binding winged helix-turn-helix (wHTH) protein/TolB-like protein